MEVCLVDNIEVSLLGVALSPSLTVVTCSRALSSDAAKCRLIPHDGERLLLNCLRILLEIAYCRAVSSTMDCRTMLGLYSIRCVARRNENKQ